MGAAARNVRNASPASKPTIPPRNEDCSLTTRLCAPQRTRTGQQPAAHWSRQAAHSDSLESPALWLCCELPSWSQANRLLPRDPRSARTVPSPGPTRRRPPRQIGEFGKKSAPSATPRSESPLHSRDRASRRTPFAGARHPRHEKAPPCSFCENPVVHSLLTSATSGTRGLRPYPRGSEPRDTISADDCPKAQNRRGENDFPRSR